MDAINPALLSFIYIVLALLIVWLAYVIVCVWLEARSAFLRQYRQRGQPAEPVVDEPSAETSHQPQAPAPQRRCEPGE